MNSSKFNRLARYGLYALATFVPFLILCWYRLDPDFGWHVQAGNYIRAHGIPSHDVFTYTAQSFHWINHEWLSDVLLSAGYAVGGYGLLAVVTAALWTLALLLAAGRKANPAVLLVAALAAAPYVSVRPTVVTVVCFAVTLAVLRRGHLRYYWFLPLLILLWANLHAGFITGLALIGYYALARRSKRLGLILLLSFAATFVNAYGIRIYEEVLRTVFSPDLHHSVSEWQSFHLRRSSVIYIALWGAGFWLYQRPFWRRWLGLGPILLLASLSAGRNIPLLVLATVQDLDRYVRLAVAALPKRLDRPRRIILSVLASLLVALIVLGGYTASKGMSTDREAEYPAQAVAYLLAHPCPGHVYNNYNYGGYLIWKLPDSKVFIDGRMPSWEPYMTTYTKLVANPAKRYKSEFTKYNVQCAVLSDTDDKVFIRVLKHDGWRAVPQGKGNQATLLVSPAI